MKKYIKYLLFEKYNHNRLSLAIYLIIWFLLATSNSFGLESSPIQMQIGYAQNSDSSKTLNAKVTLSDGTPVKDIEVHFYVKRLFGLLPIESSMGNIPTDEKGETVIDLPKKDFPGDSAGNIIIVAKIEDNETYGNIETQKVLKIGIPLKVETDSFPRALWAPQAPFALILTFVVMIGGVWLIYCFVAFQIHKIKKAGADGIIKKDTIKSDSLNF